jgi:hypothetical protein
MKNFKTIWRRKKSSQYKKKKHADKYFLDYRRKRELLWKKERICVPKSKKIEVFRERHDIAIAGHSRERMYKILRQDFY